MVIIVAIHKFETSTTELRRVCLKFLCLITNKKRLRNATNKYRGSNIDNFGHYSSLHGLNNR